MSQGLRIIFAGTPEFAAEILQALLQSEHEICAVYSQPDRPAGRGRKLKASAVKQLALAHDLPVYQPSSLNDPQQQQMLKELNADLMVVVAYGLLLPKAVLQALRLGCVNVHASLLPRWRGAAPIQRAIQYGDEVTGVTIMQMDEGLDTGPMLLKASTEISDEDTAETLHDRLAGLGATALLQSLQGIAQGTAEAEAQNNDQANYAHKIAKKEAQLNWQQGARTLHNLVRAFNPWPVCSAQLDDQVLRIWQTAVNDTSCDEAPGTVINEGKHGIEVATGDGVLRLLRVQLPGGKPLTAQQFLNAHSLLGKTLR